MHAFLIACLAVVSVHLRNIMTHHRQCEMSYSYAAYEPVSGVAVKHARYKLYRYHSKYATGDCSMSIGMHVALTNMRTCKPPATYHMHVHVQTWMLRAAQ
jgi:hypothetical protein